MPRLAVVAGFLLPMVCLIIASAIPSAGAIDCFKCVSMNGTNAACDDPFHNNHSVDILESPCMGGRKGRDGLFPATSCIKIAGIYDDTGERITVRGCALDSGTLTTDTEIIRMSHCGRFYYDDRYVHGCLQSCSDSDACNSGPSLLPAQRRGYAWWALFTVSHATALISLLYSLLSSLLFGAGDPCGGRRWERRRRNCHSAGSGRTSEKRTKSTVEPNRKYVSGGAICTIVTDMTHKNSGEEQIAKAKIESCGSGTSFNKSQSKDLDDKKCKAKQNINKKEIRMGVQEENSNDASSNNDIVMKTMSRGYRNDLTIFFASTGGMSAESSIEGIRTVVESHTRSVDVTLESRTAVLERIGVTAVNDGARGTAQTHAGSPAALES